MRMIKAQIDAAIIQLTGVIPEDAEPADGAETQETETRKPDGTKTTQTKTTSPGVQPPSQSANPGMAGLDKITGAGGRNMMAELATQAYGTKLPQRRDPDKENT